MKITNAVLTDFDDKPLKDATGTTMTLANVLVNCAMADMPPGGPRRTAEEIVKRSQIALDLHKLEVGKTYEISLDMAKVLKDDALRLYPPITTRLILHALDPALFADTKVVN